MISTCTCKCCRTHLSQISILNHQLLNRALNAKDADYEKLRATLKLIAALVEEQDEPDRTITEIEIYANAVNTLAALASHNGTTGQVE